MLRHRGVLDQNSYRTPLADHLLEVIALMDMETFTLNRVTPCLKLWIQHVSERKSTGVEEISGLPYSLINIMSELSSRRAEEKLMSWSGERSDVFAQQHMWEAFRLAGVLHNRALLKLTNSPFSPSREFAGPCMQQDVILAKILASLQALTEVSEPYDKPFAHTVLYPLFIASLYAEEGSNERAFTEKAFPKLLQSRTSLTGRVDQPASVAFDVVREVWQRSKVRSQTTCFALAIEFIAELGIELHLY